MTDTLSHVVLSRHAAELSLVFFLWFCLVSLVEVAGWVPVVAELQSLALSGEFFRLSTVCDVTLCVLAAAYHHFLLSCCLHRRQKVWCCCEASVLRPAWSSAQQRVVFVFRSAAHLRHLSAVGLWAATTRSATLAQYFDECVNACLYVCFIIIWLYLHKHYFVWSVFTVCSYCTFWERKINSLPYTYTKLILQMTAIVYYISSVGLNWPVK